MSHVRPRRRRDSFREMCTSSPRRRRAFDTPRYQAAAAAYAKAADLDESEDSDIRKDALFNWGDDCLNIGAYPKSAEVFRRLVALDEADGFHRLRLARALRGAGDHRDALAEAQRASGCLQRMAEDGMLDPDEVDTCLENDRQAALREAADLVTELAKLAGVEAT